MTKKLFLVLLFPFIADLAISCCNCLDTLTHHYSNKTITVSALDNSGREPKEISAGSVFKTAYGSDFLFTQNWGLVLLHSTATGPW